jgi:hypothetical protein
MPIDIEVRVSGKQKSGVSTIMAAIGTSLSNIGCIVTYDGNIADIIAKQDRLKEINFSNKIVNIIEE